MTRYGIVKVLHILAGERRAVAVCGVPSRSDMRTSARVTRKELAVTAALAPIRWLQAGTESIRRRRILLALATGDGAATSSGRRHPANGVGDGLLHQHRATFRPSGHVRGVVRARGEAPTEAGFLGPSDW
jgi:hypothetical protein